VSLSPETLLPESDWDKKHRQMRTGVLGEGRYVECRPNPFDQTVTHTQHRSVCLARPLQACNICPHAAHTLVFKSQPDNSYEVVACPRWNTRTSRSEGNSPDSYVPVEVGTCRQRPFDLCNSCPTIDQVQDIGADKHKTGWYGRWHRFVSVDPEDADG
jgi:hypothetical protein